MTTAVSPQRQRPGAPLGAATIRRASTAPSCLIGGSTEMATRRTGSVIPPAPTTHNASCAKSAAADNAPSDVEQRYLLSLPSPRSRAAMATCISRLVGLTGGGWSTFDRLAVLRAVRGLDGLSPSTQRLHVACLRGLLRTADADPRVVEACRSPRGDAEPVGRALSRAEERALVAAGLTQRDRALVLVLLGSGVRVSEFVALEAGDFDGELLVVRSGKGRKPRAVALPADTAAALSSYLGARTHGPLFCTRALGRLSPRGVQGLLQTLSKRAGIGHVSPHDLRRSCVTNAAAAGASINAVRVHVGHALLTTTQRYLRADPIAESRKVAAALSTSASMPGQ
jgi:integrase